MTGKRNHHHCVFYLTLLHPCKSYFTDTDHVYFHLNIYGHISDYFVNNCTPCCYQLRRLHQQSQANYDPSYSCSLEQLSAVENYCFIRHYLLQYDTSLMLHAQMMNRKLECFHHLIYRRVELGGFITHHIYLIDMYCQHLSWKSM